MTQQELIFLSPWRKQNESRTCSCKSLKESLVFFSCSCFSTNGKMGALCQKRSKGSKKERWKVSPRNPTSSSQIDSVLNTGHRCIRCSGNTLHTRSRNAGAGESVKIFSPHLQPSAQLLPGLDSFWGGHNSFQTDAEY